MKLQKARKQTETKSKPYGKRQQKGIGETKSCWIYVLNRGPIGSREQSMCQAHTVLLYMLRTTSYAVVVRVPGQTRRSPFCLTFCLLHCYYYFFKRSEFISDLRVGYMYRYTRYSLGYSIIVAQQYVTRIIAKLSDYSKYIRRCIILIGKQGRVVVWFRPPIILNAKQRARNTSARHVRTHATSHTSM